MRIIHFVYCCPYLCILILAFMIVYTGSGNSPFTSILCPFGFSEYRTNYILRPIPYLRSCRMSGTLALGSSRACPPTSNGTYFRSGRAYEKSVHNKHMWTVVLYYTTLFLLPFFIKLTGTDKSLILCFAPPISIVLLIDELQLISCIYI